MILSDLTSIFILDNFSSAYKWNPGSYRVNDLCIHVYLYGEPQARPNLLTHSFKFVIKSGTGLI